VSSDSSSISDSTSESQRSENADSSEKSDDERARKECDIGLEAFDRKMKWDLDKKMGEKDKHTYRKKKSQGVLGNIERYVKRLRKRKDSSDEEEVVEGEGSEEE
jgi:hypothetical protein